MDATIQLTALGSSALLLLICIIPLGLAVMLLVQTQLRPLLIQLAPWAALPALLVAYGAETGGIQDFHWTLLGMQLGLDTVGQHFLGFSALIWWLGGFFVLYSLRDSPRQAEFVGFFLLSMSGNLGVILAQEVSSFYFFYALMSFAAYGLVIYTRTPETIRAGWVYLSFVLIGEMCLLVAILASVYAAGGSHELSLIRQTIGQAEHQHLIILMILLGFGSKIGLLGLHFSLPIAYQAIPVAGAIVLGGAMLNAGLLGWLRFLPLSEATHETSVLFSWSHVFISLGLLAAFYAAIMGLLQTQFKALLAYSSMSQMGVISIIMGLALQHPGSPLVLPLLLAYALHHALAKTTLFYGGGMLTELNAGWRRWLVLVLLLIPALSIAGLPYTSGMAVKATLKTLAAESQTDWQAVLPMLLMLSSIATTLLLGRYFWLLQHTQPDSTSATNPQLLPFSVWFGWWGLFFAMGIVTIQLQVDYASILAKKDLLWESIPVGLGIGVVVLAVYFRGHWPQWQMPAGDVFWSGWQLASRCNCAVCDQFDVFKARLPREMPGFYRLQTRFVQLLTLEENLLAWPVAGLVLLSLLIVLMSLMVV